MGLDEERQRKLEHVIQQLDQCVDLIREAVESGNYRECAELSWRMRIASGRLEDAFEALAEDAGQGVDYNFPPGG